MSISREISKLYSTNDGTHRISAYQWGDIGVRVYDDADTALRIIELFADGTLPAAVKSRLLPKMLFVDPTAALKSINDIGSFLDALLWDMCGLDITGARADQYVTQTKVFDWEADEAYMRASLYTAYGSPLDELRRSLSYKELCQLIGLVPHETPMGQALYYRTAKPPRATKYNRDEVRAFQEKKRFYALKPKSTVNAYEAMNRAATAAFTALRGR